VISLFRFTQAFTSFCLHYTDLLPPFPSCSCFRPSLLFFTSYLLLLPSSQLFSMPPLQPPGIAPSEAWCLSMDVTLSPSFCCLSVPRLPNDLFLVKHFFLEFVFLCSVLSSSRLFSTFAFLPLHGSFSLARFYPFIFLSLVVFYISAPDRYRSAWLLYPFLSACKLNVRTCFRY